LLHCTPNDNKFKNLTIAQKLWFISNINKDKEDLLEQLKYLCIHIRPEAYKDELSGTTSVSTDFREMVEGMVGRPLSDDELLQIDNPEAMEPVFDGMDVDTIERVG